MKLASWNVNGLRAAVAKGFEQIVADIDADCFSVQETKLQAGQLDLQLPGYHSYYSYAEKKGYSGVATFSKPIPISTVQGIGSCHHDCEGRALTLEFEKFYLINVYSPNSQGELRRIDYRLDWEQRLLEYMKRLDATKPVVLCGDLNVAHKDIDLKHPELNQGATGFSEPERAAFQRLLDAGFVDTWRFLYPEVEKIYTWWSYQQMSRRRNDGWRIDYFIVSQRLVPHIRQAEILTKVMGSDHCPVTLTLDI